MKGMKKRVFLIYVIGAIVARAAFVGINPLAIGYFSAVYIEKAGGGFLFLAILLGLFSSMAPIKILKYIMTLTATMVIFEAPWFKKKTMHPMVKSVIPAIILGIFSIIEATSIGYSRNEILLAILETVIAFISSGVFQKGITYVLRSNKNTKVDNEQMLSMAVMVAVVVYAVPEFANTYIAPLHTVVYFAILFYTYKYGAGQGTVTGALCGLVLSLRGAPFTEVGFLCMIGIIPAIFRELGRIPTAAIYVVTTAVMGLLYEEMILPVDQIGAMISAILLFLLLPSGIIYRTDTASEREQKEYLATQNIRNIAKARMKVFADSFMKLSKSLDTISEKQSRATRQEINTIFEDISEKLCKNCIHCKNCWENNFAQTYEAACNMFEQAEKKGSVTIEDLPLPFAKSCVCADQFIYETNRGFEIAKLNHVWHNKMAESREVIAGQLREVSSVIQDISGNLYGVVENYAFEEERIRRGLKMNHIISKNITLIERSDKRKEVYLNAACKYGHCVTTKEAATIISEELGVRMRVSEASKTVISKDYETYIFMEDTKFKVLTGVSRAMKENISGDNFSILKLDNGQVMLAISDGMGTGKIACQESEAVIALLEQLFEAGFKAETAIRLINSNLVLKEEEQTLSTVDLSVIDLFTGICEFVKIGAAAAFIKRDNWVETISSTTLPIGMLGNVDYDTVTKKLYEGDIVIMVTDGVLDCIPDENKEEYMENLIMNIKSCNPQEIANQIMEKTLTLRDYVPMDDMTVITAGLWLK
jgi:stage II sporulation protein E